jgi:hypothetical protein
MADEYNERTTRIDWPTKALQSVALKQTTGGDIKKLELAVVVLVPFKVHPSAQTSHKAIGVSVPITEDERQALIAVLQGKPNGDTMDGADKAGKGEASLEAHSRDSGNGGPRSAAKKTRKV